MSAMHWSQNTSDQNQLILASHPIIKVIFANCVGTTWKPIIFTIATSLAVAIHPDNRAYLVVNSKTREQNHELWFSERHVWVAPKENSIALLGTGETSILIYELLQAFKCSSTFALQ